MVTLENAIPYASTKLENTEHVIPHSFEIKDCPDSPVRKLLVFKVNGGEESAREAIRVLTQSGWPQTPDDGLHDGQFAGSEGADVQEVRMPFVPPVKE